MSSQCPDLTKLWNLCATERADVLIGKTPRQLIDFAIGFELPWELRSRAINYYPQIVSALCCKLAEALGQVEVLEAAVHGFNPCADEQAEAACDEAAGGFEPSMPLGLDEYRGVI